MTILMHSAKRFGLVLFLSSLFAVALAPRAEAQQLSLQAVDVAVTAPQDGTAQATFRIKVTNNEQTPLVNFVVTFKDGTTALLGDVPAQDSLVSQPQTKFIDASTPSASIPIPVTLTYTLDGNPVEIPWAIVLTRS
jgi:hypothetical protein